MYEKLVLVTRKTRLAGLIERFNTRAQAKFYLEHAGLDFADYQLEDDTYRRSVDAVRESLDFGLKLQVLDRSLISTYFFADKDVVVAIGQDGLVANTAKYIGAQPLLGVNPDPSRYDGQLLPFEVDEAAAALGRTLENRAQIAEVTLARVELSDGQALLAFNDFFIGQATHVSAQYRLKLGPRDWERQSSSGLIVSTGAGSTGWLSSVFQMAASLGKFTGTQEVKPISLAKDDPRLFFAVREPFVSRHSSAFCTAGYVSNEAMLNIESLMPTGGVIFSDGMEEDRLAFTSGLVAKVKPADQRARLVLA